MIARKLGILSSDVTAYHTGNILDRYSLHVFGGLGKQKQPHVPLEVTSRDRGHQQQGGFRLSLYVALSLSASLFMSLSLYLFLCQSVDLSVSVSLSLCLCIYVSISVSISIYMWNFFCTVDSQLC